MKKIYLYNIGVFVGRFFICAPLFGWWLHWIAPYFLDFQKIPFVICWAMIASLFLVIPEKFQWLIALFLILPTFSVWLNLN